MEEFFELHISSKKEGNIIEVPFQVIGKIERLVIKISVSKQENEESVIDLGLRDKKRVRGWSGSARQEVEVGLEYATPGYIAGELKEGEWAVLLGLYKIPKNGCVINVNIEQISKHYRWLKGDLHLHSIHSDGIYNIEENIKIAEDLNLDFISLTDHNTSTQNFVDSSHNSITLIPGMELSTYKGHINIFGLQDPLIDFRISNIVDLQHKLEKIKQQGGFCSVNHPFDNDCGWGWGWNLKFDWVEVWNGHWRKINEIALNWWEKQLIEGRKIVAVGGSDAHGKSPFITQGFPTTFVYSLSHSSKDILEAINKGHCFISYSPWGPTVDIKFENSMIGDVVEISNNHLSKVLFNFDNLKERDEIRILNNQGLHKKIVIGPKEDSFSIALSIAESRFFRVEIWRYFKEIDQILLATLSNPIFFP